MRVLHSLLTLALAVLPARCNQEPEPNVNSRYVIESVEISPRAEHKLSSPLKADFQKLVGEKFNQEAVDRLLRRLKTEMHGYRVVQKITKGSKPENIRVVIDVMRGKYNQDVVLPRLVYHSRENFSF